MAFFLPSIVIPENEESLSSDKGTICLDSVQIDKGLKDEVCL